MLRVLSLESRPVEERDRGFYGFGEHQPPSVDKKYLIQIGRDALYRTKKSNCKHKDGRLKI